MEMESSKMTLRKKFVAVTNELKNTILHFQYGYDSCEQFSHWNNRKYHQLCRSLACQLSPSLFFFLHHSSHTLTKVKMWPRQMLNTFLPKPTKLCDDKMVWPLWMKQDCEQSAYIERSKIVQMRNWLNKLGRS